MDATAIEVEVACLADHCIMQLSALQGSIDLYIRKSVVHSQEVRKTGSIGAREGNKER